jgi:hypothetical protein
MLKYHERILLMLSVLRLSHLAWFIIKKPMMLPMLLVISRQPSEFQRSVDLPE